MHIEHQWCVLYWRPEHSGLIEAPPRKTYSTQNTKPSDPYIHSLLFVPPGFNVRNDYGDRCLEFDSDQLTG